MNKQPCYCKKCKGAIVSKRTFRRHLLKEQYIPYIKHNQNNIKKNKYELFDVYSNRSSPILPSPNELSENDDAISFNVKSKIRRSIPSIPILQENSINIPDFTTVELKDNDSVISENDTDFTDDYNITKSNSDEINFEYENLKENYTNISYYDPVNINSQIFDANEITRQVILWVYLFQDTFTLSQTASAMLLDFLKELSFNEKNSLNFLQPYTVVIPVL